MLDEAHHLRLLDTDELDRSLARHPRRTGAARLRKLLAATIDFLWSRERVAVETDGRDSHERAAARERDYRRDAWLNAHGYRPFRFTYAQVNHRPHEVLAALRAVLPEGR